MNQAQEYLKDNATPVNLLKVLAALGASYLTYKTLAILYKRRKYRLIPGPSANGFVTLYFLFAYKINRQYSYAVSFTA